MLGTSRKIICRRIQLFKEEPRYTFFFFSEDCSDDLVKKTLQNFPNFGIRRMKGFFLEAPHCLERTLLVFCYEQSNSTLSIVDTTLSRAISTQAVGWKPQISWVGVCHPWLCWLIFSKNNVFKSAIITTRDVQFLHCFWKLFQALVFLQGWGETWHCWCGMVHVLTHPQGGRHNQQVIERFWRGLFHGYTYLFHHPTTWRGGLEMRTIALPSMTRRHERMARRHDQRIPGQKTRTLTSRSMTRQHELRIPILSPIWLHNIESFDIALRFTI